MPFYCGKRSAGICVVLGPKKSSTYSLGKERVLACLGLAGAIGYACGFFEPAALHLPASPSPRNEGLLGQAPRSRMALIGILSIAMAWSLVSVAFGQVMGEEAELERLQHKAEEAMANEDADGAAMNIGKAALMAGQLASRQKDAGRMQW